MEKSDFASVAQRYEARVREGCIEADRAQKQVAAALDRVLDDIRTTRMSSKSSALGWLFAKRREKRPERSIRGLYIHGAVGRGKTMLMDLFHAAVPARRKRRVHFHDFMADVHKRIHAHREALKRGEVREDDPIPPVAAQIFSEAWVLCFDEFSVTDIADAMILSRLFSALFERGAVLVATSNVAPDDLYGDGLNRQLFLPFVDLLKRRVEVMTLDARTDYRLEKLDRMPVYLHPVDQRGRALFEESWRTATDGRHATHEMVKNNGREIPVPKAVAGAARFSFGDLCANPLGASDYAEIARNYDTLFIEDVPQLARNRRNEAKRFINLIDTLYDMKKRVVVLAAAEPGALYAETTGTEAFEFERTASRLIEMQSREYLEVAGKVA